MTASREPEPLPATDAPTVRLRLVGTLPPSPEIPPAGIPVQPVQPALPAVPAVPVKPAVAAKPTPAPRPQKSRARRIARKILGPNLLTKRD